MKHTEFLGPLSDFQYGHMAEHPLRLQLSNETVKDEYNSWYLRIDVTDLDLYKIISKMRYALIRAYHLHSAHESAPRRELK